MPIKQLPPFLGSRKACFSMFIDEATGLPFKDDASIFRCSVLHDKTRGDAALPYKQRSRLLSSAARSVQMCALLKLMNWCELRGVKERDFHGVPLDQFDELERFLQTAIRVYRYEPPAPPTPAEGEGEATDLAEQLVMLHEAEEQPAARCHLVYAGATQPLPGGVMTVNVYTDARGVDHFSYIADVRRFAATYVCEKCHYVFTSAAHVRRHKAGNSDCDEVQHLFPGNGAVLAPTLFDRLAEVGVRVDEARRYSPYFAVFDFESCARAIALNPTFEKITYYDRLPEADPPRPDPDHPDYAARIHFGAQWSSMRTHWAPDYRFFVRRALRANEAAQLARAFAAKQEKCFNLRIKLLLLADGKLDVRDIGTFSWIRKAADFEEALTTLLCLLEKALQEPGSYWSVRFEAEPTDAKSRYMSPLEAVSVAVATNVSGMPSSFLCRRRDNEPVNSLVSAFVGRLHEIQAVAAGRMRRAFASEIERLAEFADGYTRILCGIFVRALADARQRVAALKQKPAQGEVRAPTPDPVVVKLQEAHVEALAEVDLDTEDFVKLRLTKKQKAAMHYDAVTDYYVAASELRKVRRLQKDLFAFCNVLPVFGFNSGTFDIKLVRPWLLPLLQEQQAEPIRLLKKSSKYLQVATERLRFLDVSNYLAPFTPYAKWITAYTHGADTKGAWCYDYFERPSQLRETRLPPREAFDSVLKGTRCSAAQYAEIQQIWRENGMRTLYDYLRHYNLRDVEPFVEALEAMRAFWQANGHDMFNNVCTLPGLADRFVRTNFLPPHTNLVLPQKRVDRRSRRVLLDNSDLFYDMRRSIVGGPACVYHRLHVAGETRLRGNGAVCQHIVGWDCNGLYLWCSAQRMPTGIPVRYTLSRSGFYKRSPLYRKMQSQLEWLEWTAHVFGYDIRHQFNSAKPPFVAGQRPDGYCVTPSGARVVFFFDGCRYHGHGGCAANPRSRFPAGMHPHKKQRQDFAIRKALEARGYIIHRFRECDWLRMKKDNKRASEFDNSVRQQRPDGRAYDPTLREFLAEHLSLPQHGKMTEAGLLAKVRRGRFFGSLVCDVEVPESLRAHFAEIEPIFKNATVTEADLSPHMADVLRRRAGPRSKRLMHPKRTLVNSFFAKDFVLHTPLARWYQEHGLIIRNVKKAYEYKPKVLYGGFARAVAEQRRRADDDPDFAIKGDLFKLAGNSIYGKSITAVERHTQTRMCSRKQVAQLTRNPRMVKSVDLIGVGRPRWAEVCLRKKRIEHTLYTPFGSFVYQYAKLRMLQFYYDYIDFYWKRKHFQLMYMDTDSFYVALAQPSLAEFLKKVRPARLAQFNANYPEQFLARDDPDSFTAEQIKWDRREVGLFHVETHAKKMLALNPKSYICVDVSPSGFEKVQKLSAKGVLRAQNPLTWNTFYEVLQKRSENIGTSSTLRRPHGRQEVCFVTAPKRCLSYVFFKRRLCDDGVSTEPLGL